MRHEMRRGYQKMNPKLCTIYIFIMSLHSFLFIGDDFKMLKKI